MEQPPVLHTPTHEEWRLRAVRIWAVVGGLVIFVAAMYALGYIASVIEFLGVGCLLGFICSPMVNALERRGVSRGAGALIALLVVIAIIIAFFALLVPLIADQMISLLDRVPAFFKQGQEWLRGVFETYGTAQTADLQTNMTTVLESLSSVGTRFATDLASTISTGLIPNVMNLFNVFLMFFLGIILGYWLARDYPVIVRELCVIAGPKHQDNLILLLAVTSRSIGGYMRGTVITSVLLGAFEFVCFLIVGQPYAGLMGILACVLHFIPVVGPWISAALATLTALFVSPMCALWTLIISVVAENVIDNLISPIVMRSAVQVHPAMSLLAIVVGSALGGVVGMAISIPVSAAIKGIFIYYFESRTGRQIVSFNGAIFQGTPYHYPNGACAPTADALDDDKFYDTSRLVNAPEGIGIAPSTNPSTTKPSAMSEVFARATQEARAIIERVDGKLPGSKPVGEGEVPEASVPAGNVAPHDDAAQGDAAQDAEKDHK